VFFAQHDVVFVLEGQKHFGMQDRKLSIPKGNAAFVPRGCYLMAGAFPDNAGYQSLLFFFDKQLIHECTEQHKELFLNVSKGGAVTSLVRPRVTPAFAGFAHSMLCHIWSCRAGTWKSFCLLRAKDCQEGGQRAK
jgi:hypothetical protein